jgi:TonB family protein
VAVISMAAALGARAARMRSPECALACWQALLGALMLLPWLEPWSGGPTAGPGVAIAATAAGRVPSLSLAHLPVAPLLGAIVIAGIAARLMWLAMGYLRLRRWRREASPVGANQAVIETLRTSVDSPVEVYLSPEVPAPVTFGLRPAVVLLPERWLDLDPNLQRAIVCHEFLHVRRRDWGFHVAEEIIRALAWFHPAVWWLTAEIRLAREQVIDRMVVRLTARRPYVEALLAFANVECATAAAPAFSPRHHLKQRISSLVEEVSVKKSSLIVSFASVTLCVAIAMVFTIRTFPLRGQDRAVHSVSEPGVRAPKVVYKVDPNYTQEARDAKIEGTVVVDVEVHADGKAHNLRVERTLDPGLDQRALDAISAWRFQPATKNGKPIAVKATIEINFKLS